MEATNFVYSSCGFSFIIRCLNLFFKLYHDKKITTLFEIHNNNLQFTVNTEIL